MNNIQKFIYILCFLLSALLVVAFVIDHISNTLPAYFITLIVWGIIWVVIHAFYDSYRSNKSLRQIEKRSKLHNMDGKAAFDFDFLLGGNQYRGKIIPSIETDNKGVPKYFRIIMGIVFFAYLCCEEGIWKRRDGRIISGESDLIEAIGQCIKAHYSPKQ